MRPSMLTLILFGSASSKDRAQAILNNLPQVKRLLSKPSDGLIRLETNGCLHEMQLLYALASSGIDGFKLIAE